MREKLTKGITRLVFLLSLFFVVFHIYTAMFGVVSGVGQKALHIGIIMTIFFLREMIKPNKKAAFAAIDLLLCIGSVASVTYLITIDKTLALRSGIVYPSDIIFGLIFIVALMEATRRVVGNSLTIVVGCFIAYAFLGQYLPSFLKFAGMSVKRFVEVMCLGSDGIFGVALYSSAAFIVLFIILGAIFQETGVGNFFTDLATLGFGKYSGGPAKVSVVASGFFGSISGSAIANVISTGTFTIPMMKDCGFKDEYAGAVEAAASTGGQIMPPVMGATAFLIAEVLNISYFEVVKAAFIPAILYYVAILMTVHLNAKKNNLKGIAASKMPDAKAVLRKCYLALPLIALLIMMGVYRMTVARAGMWCIFMTIILVELSPDTRITKESFKRIIIGSINGTIPVAIACAVVGIITGVVMATGLGFRLSSILLDLAHGNMILLLVLTMVASLIMGMGMPTTAAYMVLEILVAPALVEMGVLAIAAHLFILYFGIISNITPPVALAAYAASGLAKSNPTKTGVQAFKLAISGFILPFMFVYNPVLLCQGNLPQVVQAIVTSLLGVYCLSCAMENFFVRWRTPLPERLLLLGTAFLLIHPGTFTDIIGIAIVAALYLANRTLNRPSAPSTTGATY
ncbi:TRAP transporter fused permease subunit [Clostridiales bacterium]